MLRNTNQHKAKTASGTGANREYGGIHIWARATIQALHPHPPLVQITPWPWYPATGTNWTVVQESGIL